MSAAKGDGSPASTLAVATCSRGTAAVPKPAVAPWATRTQAGRGPRRSPSSQDSWNRTKSCHVRQGCWYRRYHNPLPLCPVLSNAGERSGSGKSLQFSKRSNSSTPSASRFPMSSGEQQHASVRTLARSHRDLLVTTAELVTKDKWLYCERPTNAWYKNS